MVVLVELKGSFPPFMSGPPSKLSTAVWVRLGRSTGLDPMGMLTHPQQTGGVLWRCWNDEIVVERRSLVKDGELTEPMVDVISQVTADCLDPDGNIDKESRPVQSIR